MRNALSLSRLILQCAGPTGRTSDAAHLGRPSWHRYPCSREASLAWNVMETMKRMRWCCSDREKRQLSTLEPLYGIPYVKNVFCRFEDEESLRSLRFWLWECHSLTPRSSAPAPSRVSVQAQVWPSRLPLPLLSRFTVNHNTRKKSEVPILVKQMVLFEGKLRHTILRWILSSPSVSSAHGESFPSPHPFGGGSPPEAKKLCKQIWLSS